MSFFAPNSNLNNGRGGERDNSNLNVSNLNDDGVGRGGNSNLKRENGRARERLFWLAVCAVPLACVFVAHLFFQIYLYMPPCEQCVYARFYMLAVALGAAFALVWRGFLPLGYALGFWGCFEGARVCLRLNAIHKAIESGNSFGVKGCKMTPEFPFGLRLDEWYPSLFKPAGECGLDAPFPPLDAHLDAVQTWFADFYAQGWFLLPQFKFINMGEACLVVFILLALALLARTALDLRSAYSNLKKGRK